MPSAPVVVVVTRPLILLVTITIAPETTAPLESFRSPVKVPEVSWDHNEAPPRNTAHRNSKVKTRHGVEAKLTQASFRGWQGEVRSSAPCRLRLKYRLTLTGWS